MALNKNAQVRYLTLDRCFRNPGKDYTIDMLVEACNEDLLDLNPNSTGVPKQCLKQD